MQARGEAESDGMPGAAPHVHGGRRLVLVTGSGRSGTSTVAGTLNYLGLHVPLPVLGANKSNPRGFFESRWPMEFHREIMDRAVIDRFDARPEALAFMREAVTLADRQKLHEWLSEVASTAPQIVVKDPRSSWLPELWSETASALGLTVGFVTMLRHPAEVVASHSTYYAKNHDAEWVRRYEVVKLAGWVNANLVVERLTRGQPRAFVRYDDLIGDWRTVAAKLRADLDLTFNTDPLSREPHVVDEFIDPDLRRVRVSWDDLDVPRELMEIAEELWSGCAALAEGDGNDNGTQQRLDALHDRYASLYRDAKAIAHDAIASEAKRAARTAERRTRAQMKKKVARARAAARATQQPTTQGSRVLLRIKRALHRGSQLLGHR